MALVARAAPGTHVIIGNQVFDFGDGGRQVTQEEARLLERVLGSEVSIENDKPRKESKS
jgi:hypothetical protein